MSVAHKVAKSRQILFWARQVFASLGIWKPSMDVKTATLQKTNYSKNDK